MTKLVQTAVKPGLLRVLAAIFYDLWLIAALWFLGVIIDTLLRQEPGGNYLLLWTWWALSPLLFFGWFWTHGGQTLGMRSWRIRVVNSEGEAVGWGQALRRYLGAILSWGAAGLGFVWILLDHDSCSWHDRLSGTYLVLTEKRQKTG